MIGNVKHLWRDGKDYPAMVDRDIWIAANAMIKLYGDDATLQAAIRADALQQMGDEKRCAAWKRIIAAIDELRSAEPSGPTH